MELIEINEENIHYVYDYFESIKTTTPYIYTVSESDFTASFLHDISEGEYMFKELYAYAYIDVDHKIKAIIQYGLPNYEISYDGERNYEARVGCIRFFHMSFLSGDMGKTLYNRAMEYFRSKGITKIYAFANDYAMSCYAYQGKLYGNQHYLKLFLKNRGFTSYVESSFYTISLKRMKDYTFNDYISFEAEDPVKNRQFFKIKKGLVEIGGMEIFYINSKNIYMNFFYILDDYRGRYWGQQALMAALMMFKKLGYERFDSDVLTDNSIAIKMYTYAKMGNIGKGQSYVKEK